MVIFPLPSTVIIAKLAQAVGSGKTLTKSEFGPRFDPINVGYPWWEGFLAPERAAFFFF